MGKLCTLDDMNATVYHIYDDKHFSFRYPNVFSSFSPDRPQPPGAACPLPRLRSKTIADGRTASHHAA